MSQKYNKTELKALLEKYIHLEICLNGIENYLNFEF